MEVKVLAKVFHNKIETDAPILCYLINCADSVCAIEIRWINYLDFI